MGTGTKLCVALVLSACATGCTQTPGTGSPPSATERLRAAAVGGTRMAQDGTSHVVVAQVGLAVAPGATSVEKADAFLAAYGEVLGVDAMQLAQTDTVEGDAAAGDDTSEVVYEQRVDGVPVLGSDVRVEVSMGGAEAETAMARVVDTSHAPSSVPGITAADASAAVDALGLHASGTPSLLFVDTGFLAGATPSGLVLVWAVPALAGADDPTVYVDAQSGVERFRTTDAVEVLQRRVYSAEHAPTPDDAFGGTRTLIYEESGPVAGIAPDADEQALYDVGGRIDDYYRLTFHRDGYDNHGARMTYYAHMDTPLVHAEWRAKQGAILAMTGLTTDDVIVHEWTHAVVDKTAKLVYVGWSGAMNESIADTFASFFQRGDAQIGEGSPLGVVRDMSDPTLHSQPRNVASASTFPDGAEPDIFNDQLGVHSNSGIFNYTAYLIMHGGTNPDSGVVVPAVGVDRTQQIYYRALTRYLGGAARPFDYRQALAVAAYRYAKGTTFGITPEDCGAVIEANASVGNGPRDVDHDCWEDVADNCPMVANFDQLDTDHDGTGDACDGVAAPACRTHLQRCAMDSDCCGSSTGGTAICELGQCVDGAMCMRVGSACTAQADCCEGVPCAAWGTTGAEHCCARSADVCRSNDDCCGVMNCVSGRCACHPVGERCVTTLDCCGAAFCDDATGLCATS